MRFILWKKTTNFVLWKIDTTMCKTNNPAEDPRLEEIGRRIKALRIKKGYKSAEIFAYEHGLNRVSYWRMEKGCNLTFTSLLRLLDIHGITLEEFFLKQPDEMEINK